MTTYNNSLGPPNSIDGPLPDELGELTQLQYLSVAKTYDPQTIYIYIFKLSQLVITHRSPSFPLSQDLGSIVVDMPLSVLDAGQLYKGPCDA